MQLSGANQLLKDFDAQGFIKSQSQHRQLDGNVGIEGLAVDLRQRLLIKGLSTQRLFPGCGIFSQHIEGGTHTLII